MQASTIAIEENQDAFANEPDMMFGVCQAVGEDLGFNPFWLRVALLALLFFSPVAMLSAYAALGGVVALSRWLFPKPAAVTAEPVTVEQSAPGAALIEREPELIAA